MTRLQRWFRGLIVAEGPVGGGFLEYIECIHVFHHFYTPGRAAGARWAPFGGVAVRPCERAAVARLRRERAQTSIIRNMFDVKATSDDDTCIHAMDHAHGDPQQRSRRRLGPLRHRSVPASPSHVCRRSDAETRLDDSWRPLKEGRLRGYGQAWVTRAKREALAHESAHTTRSHASRHRHENEGAWEGARESSAHARKARGRRGSISYRLGGINDACPAAQLRLHGRRRS